MIKKYMPLSIILLLLCSGLWLHWHHSQKMKTHCYRFQIFATTGVVKLYGVDEKLASNVCEEINVKLQKIHNIINIFNPTSELSLLNKSAYCEPFHCSDELWSALQAARYAYNETGGIFDISIGPLLRLWGVHIKQDRFPRNDEVKETMEYIGLDKVVFNDQQKSVLLPHEKSYLDFGGIIKGYGLDIAQNICQKHGVNCGLVNLGGNILCLEKIATGREKFTIGVRQLNEGNQEITYKVSLLGQAIASSGNYEQTKFINGKRVQHIIDPRTGFPVKNVIAVSVVSNSGLDSDIYSTAIFIAGDKLAKRFINKYSTNKVLRITRDENGKVKNKDYGTQWRNLE